jgi:hypothetical protein
MMHLRFRWSAPLLAPLHSLSRSVMPMLSSFAQRWEQLL